MVWSSSEGSEPSLSRQDGASSSSNAREEPNPFEAGEDAIADIARELDLPKYPKPSLVRKTRAPAADEAGTSNWQDVTKPLLQVIVEDHLYFGLNETDGIF